MFAKGFPLHRCKYQFRKKEILMKWNGLLVDAYERLPAYLSNVLNGLSQDNLDWQPRPDCNSIGWLTWHLTRQYDAQTASLMNEPMESGLLRSR